LKSDGFNSKVQFSAQEDSAVKIDKFVHDRERKNQTPIPMLNKDIEVKVSANVSLVQ
jgi:hypothetical protein